MSNNILARSSFVVSLTSVFIAACALGLSIYQGHLQKLNYEVSVQPYITIVPTVDMQKNEYGYYIYNAGSGRGYIEKVEYYIGGKLIQSDNLTSLKQIAQHFGLNVDCLAFGNPRRGDSVSLDEMAILLTISPAAYTIPECTNTTTEFYKKMNMQPSDVSMKIWYKSIYNIRFLYNSADNSQTKL